MSNNHSTVVPITSPDLKAAEVSWFAPICNGDFQYLGVPDGKYRSSWENISKILKTADQLGYRNILCPSSYQVGLDPLSFISAMAPLTNNINMLAAIRCGELHPMMLARSIATIDHIARGRLTINIISSNMPGENASSEVRYQRSTEVVEILKQVWTQEQVDYNGKYYQFKGLSTDPVKPYQTNGPLLYFGGYSPLALTLCGQHCDVYLMWPESQKELANKMKIIHEKASSYNRTLDYGLRIHMIVRDTEKEAREYADFLISKLDEDKGLEIKNRALDAKSKGVSIQTENLNNADEFGYIEPNVWSGIGRARSGCGSALVGSVDQVLSKIESYQKMGFRSFIFSGYPHLNECEIFGKKILPALKTCSLPEVYGKIPATTPPTPLGVGIRK